MCNVFRENILKKSIEHDTRGEHVFSTAPIV